MFSKSHEAFSRKQHSPHAAGCFCLDSSIWRKTTPKFPGQHFGRPLREKSVHKAFPQGAKRSHEDPSCKVRFQGKVGSCARMMTRPVTRPYTMGLPPSKSPLPPVSVGHHPQPAISALRLSPDPSVHTCCEVGNGFCVIASTASRRARRCLAALPCALSCPALRKGCLQFAHVKDCTVVSCGWPGNRCKPRECGTQECSSSL